MNLIPEEELKRQEKVNWAPMVDFLFLVIAVLATLAVTRAALYDTQVDLVKTKPQPRDEVVSLSEPQSLVILSIDAAGRYRWISDFNEYPMKSAEEIQFELARQHTLGVLPQDKEKVKVLLHIDRSAQWSAIASLVFAVREAGFSVHPVYEAGL